MKKILMLFAVLALFFTSCGSKTLLYNAVTAVSLENEFLAGNIICYGDMHENSVSRETLSNFLGLVGFDKKIEEDGYEKIFKK